MISNTGDLVVYRDMYTNDKASGLILRPGSRVSLYVEDRPYRIIDTVQYLVISHCEKKIIYENQIEKVFSKRGESYV